ncbi:MAG: hypothetical protein IPH08_10400 [Rhodocyclaceae bacterium]|nr:hypothetical protein [Rhodocyclaceae bacterium]
MDIEALAKKAGFTVANGSYGLKFSGGDFELLVRLATEEEREACAKVCEELANKYKRLNPYSDSEPLMRDCWVGAGRAIRERSNVEVSGLRGFLRRSARL